MSRDFINDEILADYASGALAPGMSLLVAAHLTYSPGARARVAGFETIGGALLEETPAADFAPPSLERALAMLDAVHVDAPRPVPLRTDSVLPSCLRAALGVDEHDAPWKFRLPGLAEAELGTLGGEEISLLRAKPGARIFSHTHEGIEATLVLCGALEDRGRVYRRGDVAIATEDDDHRPRILDEGVCISFVVSSGRMRFTGPFSRALNFLAE